MKYPFFSNWIAYKRIPGQDVYYVKDYALDTESVVTSEMMTFAKKQDGKIRILLGARETFQRRESGSMHSIIWTLSEKHGVVLDGDGLYLMKSEDDFMEKYYSDSLILSRRKPT